MSRQLKPEQKPAPCRAELEPQARAAKRPVKPEKKAATKPMRTPAALPWVCPLCGAHLAEEADGTLRCSANHSFDRAKEGYWHLLPVQAMRTKAPGDSKEMVEARRAFLAAGYYAPFGEALGRLALEFAPAVAEGKKPHKVHVLDAGCGEGWYDRAVAEQFAAVQRRMALAGFDIAKPAVRLAAKALPGASYAVASSFAMPVRSAWADILLNIFSPMARDEFARVLRPGGVLLYAVPTARHLFGLKQVLYDTPYENPVQQVEYEGFEFVRELEVTDRIIVPHEMLENLFSMTPYYWKTPRGGAERLAAVESLETEIGFRFLVFRRKG